MLTVPSVALAGTRMRMFNQEDPRSIWMSVDTPEFANVEFVQKVFNYFDLKPCNIRFNFDRYPSDRARLGPSYCFVDFQTPGECIHAMLRIIGQKMPYTNPPKRFVVSFCKNPHAPEVDFVIFISNIHRNVTETELFKAFLSRYPSCRGARINLNGGPSEGIVRLADYYEQQQAKDEMDGIELGGKAISCKAADPRIKLPRQMEISDQGEQFINHVLQQIRELENARHQAEFEKEYSVQMAKIDKTTLSTRMKFSLNGAPVPKVEQWTQYEPVMMNPYPTVDDYNNLLIDCDNRLDKDLFESGFMKRGLLMDAHTTIDEIDKLYEEENNDLDGISSRNDSRPAKRPRNA